VHTNIYICSNVDHCLCCCVENEHTRALARPCVEASIYAQIQFLKENIRAYLTKEWKTEERNKIQEIGKSEMAKQRNRKTQETIKRGVWNTGIKKRGIKIAHTENIDVLFSKKAHIVLTISC